MDDHIYTYVAFDEMEYQPGLDSRPVEYRGQGWIGGDYNRFWVMARGEQSSREGVGEFEGQALYSRTVSDYFNAQVGLRLDHHYGEGESATRGLLAAGFGGLAPYWFELRSFLFVSQEGDLSARLEASYELLFTQRLVLEPEIELNAAVQDVPEFGVGSGLNDVELGARMRYEIVRELTPYVGINWLRRTGATADLARLSGEGVSHASFVAGLRWWY
jgi:copper resistance protein B